MSSRDTEHENLLDRAHAEGLVAARRTRPDLPCGLAWVNVRPGTTSFARWLLRTDNGERGTRGGVDIHSRIDLGPADFPGIDPAAIGQSLELREAYATAVAKVLKEAGITASVRTYID